MSEEQLINERKRKLDQIKDLGINPYPHKFEQKNHIIEILDKHANLKEKSSEIYKIAGRIKAMRKMGKVAFGNIEDVSENIQFYIQRDDNPEQYKLFKLLDLGDIIGIEGYPFRTQKGELSIHITKLTLLTKSLRPLPEKWHGLKDTEIRYRQRYTDLAMNKDVREIFLKRTLIIKLMREFLDKRGFLEVETPALQTVYGGANARPFTTHLNALNIDLFLSISPELYLKRLIVGGLEKVYTICKNFRNEGIDKDHNPEFTMMECYEAYADYNDMMELTENMVEYIVKTIHGKTAIEYQGKTIDFKVPWKRMTMSEAINEFVQIDVDTMSFDELKDKCSELNIEPGENKDTAINSIFEDQCEQHLIQPIFITDYPKEICPLTKTHRKDPALVERFEGFVNCMELCNAYSELNDPVDQNERLKKQEQEREKGDKEANPMDADFVRAMEIGMPTTGGLGIGVDRLIMLITNSPSIREVIFFPLMKPEQ